jgi:hypothetical protein
MSRPASQIERSKPCVPAPTPPASSSSHPPGPRVLKRGDRVRVIAFGTTFSGIRTGMSARAREVVLINILGAERQVPVASHLIAAR